MIIAFEQKHFEAAAKALREHDMAGRITVPWEKMPKSQQRKWLLKAAAALRAVTDASR